MIEAESPAENKQDYFKTIKRTSQVSAMYPIFKTGCLLKIMSILYYILFDIVLFHMGILLIWNLITKTQGDINKIAFLLSNLIPYTNAVNFLCYFQLRTALVDCMFQSAQEDFHYCSALGPTFQSMKKSLKFANIIAILLTIITAITGHQWTVVPLFSSGANGTRLLPVPIEYPFDVQSSPRYEIAYTFQALAQMMMAMEYAGIGNLYATFSILIGNQFEILCCSVRNASLSRMPASTGDIEDTGESFTNEEIVLYGSDEEFTENMKQCVEHHVALKRLCRRMDELFKPMLLSMLIGIMLMMCMSLYSVTVKFQLPTLEYTLICVLHLAVFCYFGQSISNKSVTVADAAWNNVWLVRSREGRRTTALLMQHSQSPIVLTAGGIFPLNLASFIDIVKASFSFFTLLRNMKEKQN